MVRKNHALQHMENVESASRIDVVFGEAYKQILDDANQADVLSDLCAGLADALEVPFIWVEHQGDSEALVTVASSGSGSLYRELARIPERKDDSIMGHGPGSKALHDDNCVLMEVDDEGFQPWKKAAIKQGVVAVYAVPLRFMFETRQQVWVLLIGLNSTLGINDEPAVAFLGQLANRFRDVIRAISSQQLKVIVFNALGSAGNAAFITDTSANIIWVNKAFSRLTGYPVEQVIGKSPRILKSGKMRLRYYDRLWRTISAGRVWSNETIDRDSRGELYTIRQTVSPVKVRGEISHYISIHEDISGEKARQIARERARRVDELTGLLTPALFEDRYERATDTAKRSGEHLALLLISISDFDSLMATLGQDIEELVLETLGDRVRENLREGDFAAYLGAGEFGIVLNSVGDGDEARSVGEKVLELLDEPFPLLGDRLYLTHSLGVACMPEDAEDGEALFGIADSRL